MIYFAVSRGKIQADVGKYQSSCIVVVVDADGNIIGNGIVADASLEELLRGKETRVNNAIATRYKARTIS